MLARTPDPEMCIAMNVEQADTPEETVAPLNSVPIPPMPLAWRGGLLAVFLGLTTGTYYTQAMLGTRGQALVGIVAFFVLAAAASANLKFVNWRTIGWGIIALGGGRTKLDDVVDPSVGFVITAKPGDWVEAGEPLATVFASDRSGIESGRVTLRSAIVIADEADPPLPRVSHRVTAAGAEHYARE